MLYVIAAVILALVGYLIVTYNRLVRLRNKNEEGWSGIDVQLQRRADLVPNLVEVVKGYATHEEGVFLRVTEARAATINATGPADKEQAANQMTGALKSLFAVAEDYPDLKASTNFLELQRQLAAIEEELAFARRYYNGTVENVNTAVETFPANMVAGPFGFERATYFQAGDDAVAAPRVDLDR
jgi:LemA protein